MLRPLLLTGALVVGLAPSIAATASPPSSPSNRTLGSGESAERKSQGATVTRSGTVHRVVTDTGDGEHRVETVLRSAGRTVPLRGAGDLETGASVTVTGSMYAGRLAVSDTDPGPRSAERSARARPEIRPASGHLRTLVLPVRYNAKRIDPDDYPFHFALAKFPKGWFRAVSGGELTMSSRVAPWLVTSRADACHRDRFDVLRQAKKVASRRGIKVASYDRYLVYRRCPTMSRAEALTPGNASWYYGTIPNHFGVHELGHNLGLLHASSIRCRHDKGHSMLRGSCKRDEYGDDRDVMGEGGTRQPFNAAFLDALGWPSDHVTLSEGSQVITTTSKGRSDLPEAVRVPGARGTSYWIQTYYPPQGAVVRRYRGGATDLLGAHDSWDVGRELRPGSSFTTPEGVRIRVLPRDEDTLLVQVASMAPAAPGPPQAVRIIDTWHEEALVSFEAPESDNGAPVHHYEITFPGHEETTLSWGNEDPTDIVLLPPTALGPRYVDPDYGAAYYSFVGFEGTTPTRAEVRAINEYGTSAPGRSEEFTPVDNDPVVVLDHPGDGDVVTGMVEIRGRVVNPEGSPEQSSDYVMGIEPLHADGTRAALDSEWHDSWAAGLNVWDTARVPNGDYLVRIRSQGYGYASSSPPARVRVDNPELFLTSFPEDGVLSGAERFTYDYEEPGWTFELASLELYDSESDDPDRPVYQGSSEGDRVLGVNLATAENGDYEMIVSAWGRGPDGERQRRQLRGHVRVDNPPAVITPLSPGAGDVVTGPLLDVEFETTPADLPREPPYLDVLVDGNEAQVLSYDPLTLHAGQFSDGRHSYQLRWRAGRRVFHSPKVPFTLKYTPPRVAWGSRPPEGTVLSGTAAIDLETWPSDWQWRFLRVDCGCPYGYLPVDEDQHTWDTTAWPDGTWRVRLQGFDVHYDTYSSAWRTFTIDNDR